MAKDGQRLSGKGTNYMNNLKRRTNELSRYVPTQELQAYTGLGKFAAEKVAKEAGAVIKVGRRVVYDLNKIDAHMEALTSKS